jgi:SAM-dependent methyltransferase
METQQHLWNEQFRNLRTSDVDAQYLQPADFQIDFKNAIDPLPGRTGRIIEIGCGLGATSFILDDRFRKSLLDLNPYAVRLARSGFERYGRAAVFMVADMFALPVKDAAYDLIFNSGVMEHFTREERRRALAEYARVLKKEGTIVLAVPNHFSPPYRLAYCVLKAKGKWRYPDEKMIYDMKREIRACGLVLKERRVLSRATIFKHWMGPLKGFRHLIRLLDKALHFPGYLTVLIIGKSDAAGGNGAETIR